MVANMMVLETYMVVNFRAREISQNARKLAEYSYILIKKKKKNICAIDQTQHKGAIHVNHPKNMIFLSSFL